jgi:hypothetical protein
MIVQESMECEMWNQKPEIKLATVEALQEITAT